nr:isoform 2 of serine beta-lactamase-like protein lactb, mitochondrial [Quercus suber]
MARRCENLLVVFRRSDSITSSPDIPKVPRRIGPPIAEISHRPVVAYVVSNRVCSTLPQFRTQDPPCVDSDSLDLHILTGDDQLSGSRSTCAAARATRLNKTHVVTRPISRLALHYSIDVRASHQPDLRSDSGSILCSGRGSDESAPVLMLAKLSLTHTSFPGCSQSSRQKSVSISRVLKDFHMSLILSDSATFTAHSTMESADLKARLECLKPKIESICRISGTPGASIGVMCRGEVIFTCNYGYRDVEKRLAPNEDTIYYLASLSKAVTGFAVGTLIEQDKMKWTTPVCELVKGFSQRDPEIEKESNMIDWLSHRTGLAPKNSV